MMEMVVFYFISINKSLIYYLSPHFIFFRLISLAHWRGGEWACNCKVFHFQLCWTTEKGKAKQRQGRKYSVRAYRSQACHMALRQGRWSVIYLRSCRQSVAKWGENLNIPSLQRIICPWNTTSSMLDWPLTVVCSLRKEPPALLLPLKGFIGKDKNYVMICYMGIWW